MDARKDRPPDLTDTEILMYRQGYSKGVAKYLKDNGSPSAIGPKPVGPEYLPWREDLRTRTAAFREGAHPVAQAYGMRALAAYWKRRELEPKVSTPVRRAPSRKTPAKAAAVTSVLPEDAQTILALAGRATMIGTAAAHADAMSEVLAILGLDREGAQVA